MLPSLMGLLLKRPEELKSELLIIFQGACGRNMCRKMLWKWNKLISEQRGGKQLLFAHEMLLLCYPCHQFCDLFWISLALLKMLQLWYRALKNLILSFPGFIFLSLPLLSVYLSPVDSARPSCFPDGPWWLGSCWKPSFCSNALQLWALGAPC